MDDFREILSWLLIVPGAAFCVVGGIGLLRMPEFYTRMHSASITDTLGATLILLGLLLQPATDWLIAAKLVSILVFLHVTSPTACHALVHAAYTGGHPPELGDDAPSLPAEERP